MAESSLSVYKQQILNDFNNRPNYENEFHRRAAARLVEWAKLQPGQQVLDVATGIGLAAIAAAQVVGSTAERTRAATCGSASPKTFQEGHVLGIDFDKGMLQQARQKVAATSLMNILFEEASASEQEFQESQFDVILCSSAIVYLTDIPKALRQWHNALQSGGVVAFSCLAESSPTASVLFQEVVQRYGIAIPNPNEVLGTHQKCREMLQSIGFERKENRN